MSRPYLGSARATTPRDRRLHPGCCRRFPIRVTQFVRDEQKSILGLLRQLDTADLKVPSMKPGILDELVMKLDVESRIESEVLYPPLLRVSDEPLREAIARSREGMQEVQRLCARLHATRQAGLTPSNFLINALIHAAEEHFAVDDSELFPLAEAALPEQMGSLAKKAARLARKIEAEPQYREARPERVQNPSGGEQKRRKAG